MRILSKIGRVSRAIRSQGLSTIVKGQAGAIAGRFRNAPGQENRPVGNMETLLEDLKARGFNCQAVLDVGAHAGAWSRSAKQVFPNINCFMIEPITEMSDALNAFCREHPGSRFFSLGAGGEPGTLTMDATPGALDGSHVVQGDTSHASHTRTVPVVTLDSLFSAGDIPLPQITKIDVQGYELHVLRGASNLLGQTEVFILEVSLFPFWTGSPVLHEVVAFMAEHGYVVYDFGGFMRRPIDGALGQMDVCFVRADGVLRSITGWTG